MKKAIATIGLAASLIMSGTLYPATFIVDSVSEETGTMVCISTGAKLDGHEWEFDACGDEAPGAILAGIMYDPGTPDDVTDDICLDLRWTGLWAD